MDACGAQRGACMRCMIVWDLGYLNHERRRGVKRTRTCAMYERTMLCSLTRFSLCRGLTFRCSSVQSVRNRDHRDTDLALERVVRSSS